MKQVIEAFEAKEDEGFQPTYEELKPVHGRLSSSQLFSFQPTYEELKLLPSLRRPVPQVGFQPTYEELKPWLPDGGNDHLDRFPAYLRGIETRL